MPTPEEWRQILSRLAEVLRDRGENGSIEMVAIGGVAVALRYDSGRTTVDCDVLSLDSQGGRNRQG